MRDTESPRRRDSSSRHDRRRTDDRSRHKRSPRRRSRSVERHRERSPARKVSDVRIKEERISPVARRRSTERFRDRSPRRNFNRDQRPRDRPQGHRRVPQSSFMSDSKEDEKYEWGRKETKEVKTEPVDKEKPNFGLSGKLTEDTNMVNGVVIKYTEPEDARKPNRRWRLYPFKGEQELPLLHIHRCSAFLMGRDRKVADIPLDHPSCSKQHAALQYRLVPYTKENGYQGKRIRPYLIDLESANGTFLNGAKIEPRKYYELFERDVIKFGLSSRDYVLLHEHSKGDDLDDDVV